MCLWLGLTWWIGQLGSGNGWEITLEWNHRWHIIWFLDCSFDATAVYGPWPQETIIVIGGFSYSTLVSFLLLTHHFLFSSYISSDYIMFFVFPGVGPDGTRYKTAYKCEGERLTISCAADQTIKVIRANFGRFSIAICNRHGTTDMSVNCMSPSSNRVMKRK